MPPDVLEKICVLNKICSGRSYSAIGPESNIKGSTIYIYVSLDRNTHKTKLYIDQLMKKL